MELGPFKRLKEGHTRNPAPYGEAVEAICGTVGCTNHEAFADPSGAFMTYYKCKSKFERAGWKVGNKSADLICPTCVTNTRKPRLKLVPTPEPTPQLPEPVMAVAQPTPPTREQWNKITDALEANYDSKAERYRGDYSDKKLAQELSVGFAYVAEERNRRFGAHDRNEASDESAKHLKDLMVRVLALETEVMPMISGIRQALERYIGKDKAA